MFRHRSPAIEIGWLWVELVTRLEEVEVPKDDLAGRIGVGAVARCLACLDGLHALLSFGRSDLTGLLVRNAWESWLVGVYVTVGGKAALDRVVADYAGHRETLLRGWPESHGTDADEAELEELARITAKVGKRKLRIDQLAGDVKELLEAEGRPAPFIDAPMLYSVIYRSESGSAVHAGFETLDRYLKDTDDRVAKVEFVPPSAVDADHVESLVADFTIDLACRVFRRLGEDCQRLDQLLIALTLVDDDN